MERLDDLPLFNSTKARVAEPLSVGALTAQIKKQIEPKFSSVWVKGELSNLRPSASGHLYFTLKDETAGISAVLFGWKRVLKNQRIKDGTEVILSGRVSIYPPRGTYQLVVSKIELLGEGALQLEFERLKTKLSEEGLFDAQKKMEIPHFPKKIGIVTSDSGAAVRDIISVLKRRTPWLNVVVIPSRVQGETAAQEIANALTVADRSGDFDVLVLARGGGSIEDLWCFNDEKLARVIFSTQTPTISAVGHEIDFTISDFVADLRAATPSAAAELISNRWVQARDGFDRLYDDIVHLMQSLLDEWNFEVQSLQERLQSPQDRLQEQAQRCDEWTERLVYSVRSIIERSKASVTHFGENLNMLSPLSVLGRGYSIVSDRQSGKAIVSSKKINTGRKLSLRFSDGEVGVTAD